MIGALPLLPVYTFMAWIGKTSPTFCQLYSVGLLPLSQKQNVSERVSETLHCCGVVGCDSGKSSNK